MTYKIVDIIPMVDIDKTGRFVKIYRVKFLVNGIEDFIDVPESEYTEEKVKKLIEERVKTHLKLLGK